MLDDLPARRDETEPRDDQVRPAPEVLEHLLGLSDVRRLPVDPAAEHDCRVDAEHRTLARVARHRQGFFARMSADELHSIAVRRVLLFVTRGDHVERNPELLEDRSLLW